MVGVPHGAWVDVDEETDIDMAGSDNYLIGSEYSGMGVSGYNNQICNVEKYTGALRLAATATSRLAGVQTRAAEEESES